MKLIQIISATYGAIPGWLDMVLLTDFGNGLPIQHEFRYDPGDQVGLSPQVREALPEWLLSNTPTPHDPPSIDLLGYSAAKRYELETGGKLVNGAVIATDRQSQAMITGAYSYVSQNPTAIINFKTTSGWIQANSQLIIAVADAVGKHVQACFTSEQEADAKIQSGVYTTVHDVDNHYATANLSPVYYTTGITYAPGRAVMTGVGAALHEAVFTIESFSDFQMSPWIYQSSEFSINSFSKVLVSGESDYSSDFDFSSTSSFNGVSA